MDYITRTEYDACRDRCNDRCKTCINELKDLEITCNRRYETMNIEVQDTKSAVKVNNLKWAFMSFIGSSIAGILVIIIAAALMISLGISKPEIKVQEDKKISITIPYTPPAVSSQAYADSIK